MHIVIINGPNLNLLGKREPEVYGDSSFERYFEELKSRYPKVEFEYFQSNIEGEIITRIQDAGFSADGIILNAAAFTHTSVGIGDAVRAVSSPVAEVHISNVYQRESFRHESYVSPHACGVIVGFGLLGYELALLSFLRGAENMS
jgi:3-dehydroquinate dehydratase-2